MMKNGFRKQGSTGVCTHLPCYYWCKHLSRFQHSPTYDWLENFSKLRSETVTSDPESSDKSSDRSDDNSISDKVHNAIISANSDRDSDEVSDLTGVHNLFWSHEVIIKSLDWMDECPAKPDDNESNTPI
jgi:hypothetical protein